ncbi:gfo/Idh/MocA family oxidoreductase [Acuticoccus sediminis]|uniref:Gfo/Idh/MocA family oxidoreductase n=1 Tax=Acuticoccus sediminis TaxID=2184697 RepID=A0A8B2NSA2_9HYPH|nr:Gfo/Idh/MocA family oxidoreductase [Acuticoccus sediminis]RAI01180.1 gfo/Idh/MocA family oxidoreductase [Acuticoccus sediminis]
MFRFSVVGLGMAVTPHASALADLAHRVEIIQAATRAPDRAAAFTAATGVPADTDVHAALTHPDADAVLLLTPPDTHFALGQVALDAGKHLLVEKPLDRTLASAEALVAHAAERGRTLGVVLQHRFRDAALRLAGIVADGGLGQLTMASVSVPWWRPQSYYDQPGRGTLARDGGGVLLTQAIHVVDLFRALTGPVEVVAAEATTTPTHDMETEDYASALLRLDGGAPGVLMTTTACYPGLPERIEIAGTKGSATLVGDALEVRWLTGETESLAAGDSGGTGADPMAFSSEPHRRLIADFVDAVETGRAPRASGDEALATHRLINEILGLTEVPVA